MEETKKVLVEMSLEEATDLFEKGWREDPVEKDGSQGGHDLFNKYEFVPFNLSELVDYFGVSGINHPKHYSTGKLYFVRKKNDKIEIQAPHFISETEHWKDKAPRKMYTHGPHASTNGLGPLIYQLYSQLEFLDREKIKDEYCGGKTFFIEASGKGTVAQISSLPIWNDKGDYEKFLRQTYGDKEIDERLREGSKFNMIEHPTELSNKWKMFTSALAPHGYHLSYNCIFYDLESESNCMSINEFILRGHAKVPTHPDHTFEGSLLKNFVEPRDIGNGVVVMNKDRIPKYLQRVLAL